MPTITPNFSSVSPGLIVFFRSDYGFGASWTASGGSPTTGTTSGPTDPFIWTAPGTGGVTIRITATSVSTVTILDIFVAEHSLDMRADQVAEGTEGDRTILHEMENGLPRGRRKSGRKRKYALAFNNRTEADLATIRAVYDQVGSLIPFYTYDPIIKGSTLGSFICRFDSELSVSRRDGAKCGIAISFRVKEA